MGTGEREERSQKGWERGELVVRWVCCLFHDDAKEYQVEEKTQDGVDNYDDLDAGWRGEKEWGWVELSRDRSGKRRGSAGGIQHLITSIGVGRDTRLCTGIEEDTPSAKHGFGPTQTERVLELRSTAAAFKVGDNAIVCVGGMAKARLAFAVRVSAHESQKAWSQSEE